MYNKMKIDKQLVLRSFAKYNKLKSKKINKHEEIIPQRRGKKERLA